MTNFDAPYGERHSYERLLLEEPQAEIDGLWVLNGQFFILCPTLAANPLAANGKLLVQQFEQYRTLGSAVSLVSEVPAGAVRVPPRTSAQLVLGIGEERTWSRLANDLGLILPRDFPAFDLSFDNALPGYVVTVVRELESDQMAAIQAAFEKLQIGFPFRTTVDSALEERAHRSRAQGDISLRTTRRLGRDAKFLNDEDEDLWVTHRTDLFGPAPPWLNDVLPEAFGGSSACLIDNLGAANIRTYLPIYRRVLLVAPVAGQHERTLAELGVTQAELLELMRLGRVQLVCPQSLDRYPPTLINAAAEAAPDAILLSRRLAASCVVDARHRMLLVPGCDVEQRRQMLRELHETAARADGDVERKILEANLTQFRQAWLRGEDLFNTHGAMATLWIGIGPVMARIVQDVWAAERLLEIGAAGQNVMWAGALGATLFPVDTETYSAQLWSELCASGYTGVRGKTVPVNFGEVKPVVEGLLGVDNDAPVVEFARSFDGGDVDRFRDIVLRLAEHNLDPDFLRAAVADLNGRVQAYEGRVEHQARFDAVTAAGVFAGPVSVAAGIMGNNALALATACIPLGAWLALKVTAPENGRSTWRDTLRAVNTVASRDAVLVSRLRRAVRRR